MVETVAKGLPQVIDETLISQKNDEWKMYIAEKTCYILPTKGGELIIIGDQYLILKHYLVRREVHDITSSNQEHTLPPKRKCGS